MLFRDLDALTRTLLAVPLAYLALLLVAATLSVLSSAPPGSDASTLQDVAGER